MRPKTISRLWLSCVVLGYAAAGTGAVVGMAARSDLLSDLMIVLVVVGLSVANGGPLWLLGRQYLEQRKVLTAIVEAFHGETPSQPERAALLARLNRLAAENSELVEAMGKVVVPVVVALVALLGVVLTVVARA